MSANKHTPAPWSVGATDPDTAEIEIVSEGRPYICLVLPGAVDGRTEANARLIAAAPELLDFIQHAADQLESGIQEYTGSPEEPPQPASKWDYDAGQLVGELRRLIAKATGGAA
ncbi:hypothetical protein ABB26_05160 [Stenotrophomonas humi]|uniref:Uncharacterized protein n=1 Tax=Stenotrophomonas humi TaxID=405444 RepID=A0A0R0C7I0_9GAMM|nr:hypothetical protein [Stenotrophomonas humi]KRG65195.1 hypothetical protein ABB26_05160 [Stenotrophomonas humi]